MLGGSDDESEDEDGESKRNIAMLSQYVSSGQKRQRGAAGGGDPLAQQSPPAQHAQRGTPAGSPAGSRCVKAALRVSASVCSTFPPTARLPLSIVLCCSIALCLRASGVVGAWACRPIHPHSQWPHRSLPDSQDPKLLSSYLPADVVEAFTQTGELKAGVMRKDAKSVPFSCL